MRALQRLPRCLVDEVRRRPRLAACIELRGRDQHVGGAAADIDADTITGFEQRKPATDSRFPG